MNRLIRNYDPLLIFIVVAIFIIALLSLYSAYHQPNGEILKNYAAQQMIWMLIAVAISILFIWLGYERWLDYSYIIFGFNVFLLILVLLVGDARFGAKRWLSLGLFSMQPSELCKISFILALTRYLSDNRNSIDKFNTVMGAVFICAIPVLLIIKQPDLGTALVFLPILFILLFTAGARLRHLAYILLAGLAASPILWSILKAYQRKRLMVFLNPNIDPLGAGYTVIQSKIAVGSGGLLGRGWLSGTQNQLNFLPERHTDFIFSVIGEEWGIFGAIILLGLFLMLIRRLIIISEATNDQRGRLLISGIIALLWFQIFVNVSMTIGMMPVVGLPLPLISYGGSNLLTTMVLLALAMSVRLKRKIF